MNSIIDQAYEIAQRAHKNQTRWEVVTAYENPTKSKEIG